MATEMAIEVAHITLRHALQHAQLTTVMCDKYFTDRHIFSSRLEVRVTVQASYSQYC